MRKLILSMQTSLDGYVEGPNGAVDWVNHNDKEMWDDLFELLKSVDTLLLGRKMYPEYQKYWQSALDNPSSMRENEVKYARVAENIEHVIFSRTLDKIDPKAFASKKSRIANGDIRDEVTRMKKLSGNDIVLWGGATLASTFINLNLVDEYSILVNPVILGGGKFLFSNQENRHELKLIDAKPLRSGIVKLMYKSVSKRS